MNAANNDEGLVQQFLVSAVGVMTEHTALLRNRLLGTATDEDTKDMERIEQSVIYRMAECLAQSQTDEEAGRVALEAARVLDRAGNSSARIVASMLTKPSDEWGNQ